MTLNLGQSTINKLYLGTTEIAKCYLGNIVVYEKQITPGGDIPDIPQDGARFTFYNAETGKTIYRVYTKIDLSSLNDQFDLNDLFDRDTTKFAVNGGSYNPNKFSLKRLNDTQTECIWGYNTSSQYLCRDIIYNEKMISVSTFQYLSGADPGYKGYMVVSTKEGNTRDYLIEVGELNLPTSSLKSVNVSSGSESRGNKDGTTYTHYDVDDSSSRIYYSDGTKAVAQSYLAFTPITLKEATENKIGLKYTFKDGKSTDFSTTYIEDINTPLAEIEGSRFKVSGFTDGNYTTPRTYTCWVGCQTLKDGSLGWALNYLEED